MDKRLRALEEVRRRSRSLQDELKNIDIRDHIAEVYYPLHEDICQGSHEFYNLPGGRGSGKSSFCALELILQIMMDKTAQSNALVVRKWAVTLRGSVFSQLQWAIDTLGVSEHWRSTLNPLQFVYETGQVIRLTGLDDPQKLKSIKPSMGYFKYLWMEEFSEITGEPELRNLQQSVLRGGDSFCVLRSFNPPISRARKERAEAEAKLNKLGSCPFSKGMSSKCRIQCAFYSEEGCMKSPETKGRRCPISNYGCSEYCMLYDNGCQLIKKWSE